MMMIMLHFMTILIIVTCGKVLKDGKRGKDAAVAYAGECTLRSGRYGMVTECLNNEIAAGSCGSGRDPDCLDDNNIKVYDYIFCCPLNNFSYGECIRQHGDYGQDLSCTNINYTKTTGFVDGICGSGRDRDCNGAAHMISCCEGRLSTGQANSFKLLHPAKDCKWQYAKYGLGLHCSSNQAIFGRCGSGRDADCSQGKHYHCIQCSAP